MVIELPIQLLLPEEKTIQPPKYGCRDISEENKDHLAELFSVSRATVYRTLGRHSKP